MTGVEIEILNQGKKIADLDCSSGEEPIDIIDQLKSGVSDSGSSISSSNSEFEEDELMYDKSKTITTLNSDKKDGLKEESKITIIDENALIQDGM